MTIFKIINTNIGGTNYETEKYKFPYDNFTHLPYLKYRNIHFVYCDRKYAIGRLTPTACSSSEHLASLAVPQEELEAFPIPQLRRRRIILLLQLLVGHPDWAAMGSTGLQGWIRAPSKRTGTSICGAAGERRAARARQRAVDTYQTRSPSLA